MVRRNLILAGILLLIVILIGSTGLYLLGLLAPEGPDWTLAQCVYMVVITLTTVGYGEIIDLASVPGARLFTVIVLFSGLGVSAYFLSTLTAFLVEGELNNLFWRKKMKKEIAKLSGHIIICGGGRVGRYIMDEFFAVGRSFVLIEQDERKILEMQESMGTFPALAGDATQESYLADAGVACAGGLISALADDKDNLCVVVTSRQLNPAIRILSRCGDHQFSKKLQMIGAKVIIPNFIGGLRMASQMLRPRVVDYLDTMLRDKDGVVRIEEVTVPEGSGLTGRTIESLQLRQHGNLLLLAVVRADSPHPLYNPDVAYIIQAGDSLVFQAYLDSLARFRAAYI